MSCRRKLILTVCALAMIYCSDAQTFFAKHTGSSDQFAWVAGNNDSSLIYSYSYSANGFLAIPYKSKIYKRNSYSAQLEDSLELNSPFGITSVISDLKIFRDTIFVLINEKNANLCTTNFLIRLDLNLNVVDTLINLNSSINYPELLFLDLYPNGSNKIFLFGHLSNSPGTGVIIELLSQSFDLHLLNGTGTILGKQKLTSGDEKVISWSNTIYTLDSTFVTVLDTTKIYNNGFNIYAVQRKTGNLFFAGDASGATVHFLNSEGLLNKNDSLFSGYNNLPVKIGSHSFFVNDSNQVFLSYVSNSTFPFLSNQNQWITIVKLNPNGDLIWKRHYMGDVDYHVYSISEAPFNGVFVFATRYDWTNQNNERDLYIYKIDKNGSMLGSPELGNLQPIEVVVYPNPFSNQIDIRLLNTGIQNATVALADFTGKMVLQKQVYFTFSDTHTLNTQNLPAGVYVLTLTDTQGNMLQRQKVVKQ